MNTAVGVAIGLSLANSAPSGPMSGGAALGIALWVIGLFLAGLAGFVHSRLRPARSMWDADGVEYVLMYMLAYIVIVTLVYASAVVLHFTVGWPA